MTSSREFIPVNVAVMTVSDTRNFDSDKSGRVLVDRIKESGHDLIDRTIVPDNKIEICSKLNEWVGNPEIEVVLSTGGTGLTGRDVSVEAHKAIYEKEITAFNIIFTQVSMKKIGTSALQSRACAGIARGTFLFALPGSPSACMDAWDEILIYQLDYRHSPCNLVELFPRLSEK